MTVEDAMSTTPSETGAHADEYLSRDVLESRLPQGAPEFLCPLCGCRLRYEGSRRRTGTDGPLDLEDDYSCPAGCGRYEHVRRTHRAHRVE